jgi:hypothetical protein
VLMDLQLAGKLNGLEVVGELRQRGYSGPIIAVTAYAMMGDRERCLEAGCDDYIAKPLPIPRLVSLFEHYQQALADTQAETETVEAEPVNAAVAAADTGADEIAATETETVEAELVASVPAETEPVAEAEPAAEPANEPEPVVEAAAIPTSEPAAETDAKPTAEADPAAEEEPATDQQPAEAVILPEPSFVSTSDQGDKKPDSFQQTSQDSDRKPADD